MEYQHLDFNADKPAQYSAVRKEMGVMYPKFFGAQDPVLIQTTMTKEEKEAARKTNDLIKKGHNRVLEKIKEARQDFQKAKTTGSRSGSGRIVLAHYDTLTQIYGDSSNIEPLNIGVDTASLNADEELSLPPPLNDLQEPSNSNVYGSLPPNSDDEEADVNVEIEEEVPERLPRYDNATSANAADGIVEPPTF